MCVCAHVRVYSHAYNMYNHDSETCVVCYEAAVRQEQGYRPRELVQHYGFFTGCPLHPPSETWRPDLWRLPSFIGQGWPS